ncbi:hypothetical protein F2P81_011973 [Scophthalmus maximus]|uniref:Uncharacterized protein n=1 Tax=Scophthalmus maximus TaxID=52904 RepID=A0A6A4T069_SCOMX|nr:hypothetical protein F2P81_011973 [Scophthalmus maximus]
MTALDVKCWVIKLMGIPCQTIYFVVEAFELVTGDSLFEPKARESISLEEGVLKKVAKFDCQTFESDKKRPLMTLTQRASVTLFDANRCCSVKLNVTDEIKKKTSHGLSRRMNRAQLGKNNRRQRYFIQNPNSADRECRGVTCRDGNDHIRESVVRLLCVGADHFLNEPLIQYCAHSFLRVS